MWHLGLCPSCPTLKLADISVVNTVTHMAAYQLVPHPHQGFFTFFTEDELDADSLRLRCNVIHMIVTSRSCGYCVPKFNTRIWVVLNLFGTRKTNKLLLVAALNNLMYSWAPLESRGDLQQNLRGLPLVACEGDISLEPLCGLP